MPRHRLFPLEELPPNSKRAAQVARRRIVLVRGGDGRLWALADSCPHQGARLSDGVLGPEFGAQEVGNVQLAREGEVLRCPWHNYAFDVTNGRCLLDPDRLRVKTYPVSVEDDHVVVDV